MSCLTTVFGILSWAVIIWVAISGVYCWGQDNGLWGGGPGVE